MVLRFPVQRLVLAAPAMAVAALALAAPPLATHPAVTFFSSLSEEPLARLEAAAVAPRYVRHGPFRVPAPGVEIEAPTLALQNQPCTPEDWARLLKELAAWRQLPGASDFLLTLPDGRVFVFLRSPSVGEKTFSGFVRPLTAEGASPADPLLLRIAHDGAERLRIDLRPLPKAQVFASAPTDPDASAAIAANEPGEPAASTAAFNTAPDTPPAPAPATPPAPPSISSSTP